jgi:hypothetical protein
VDVKVAQGDGYPGEAITDVIIALVRRVWIGDWSAGLMSLKSLKYGFKSLERLTVTHS